MARRFRWNKRRSRWLWLLLAAAIVGSGWSAMNAVQVRKSPRSMKSIEWTPVRRADLDAKILVGGDLKAVDETILKCEVEDIADSDGTLIVTMAENGKIVKKGEELCRLDSSMLEELAQQEGIAVAQARSTYTQASLAVEVARITLREYREGLVVKSTKDFEIRITLAKADAEKQLDRVHWAEQMFAKGYCSKGQLASERQTLAVTLHDQRKAEGEFQVFRTLQVPKEIRSFEGQLEAAENTLKVETIRLKSQEDRLAFIQRQIALCSIRAPHDGIAVIVKRGWRWEPLQPGVRVNQGQSLYTLPDPSRMEVEVSIHETVGAQVRQGMRADVRIASMADKTFPGRISSIIPMPIRNDKEWDERLRHFLARVRLDDVPSGILPLMSAEVQIDAGKMTEALVVPAEAVSLVDGQPACYVMAENGMERRTVKTGRSTVELLEVISGLDEGEHVAARFDSVPTAIP